MNSKLFTNAFIFVNKKFKRSQILVIGDTIAAISSNLSIPKDAEIIDCAGKRIIPGLIDIHTHGCNGYDFSTATPEQMHEMLRWYAKKGVTAILATTMTDSPERMKMALSNLRKLHHSQQTDRQPECCMAGIRMEGPFFGRAKKGAHKEAFLQLPDEALFRELFLACGGFAMIDIDPALPCALDFISRHRKEFVISLGHTACDYEMARKAILSGASHITHLFNAMNGMHHREPGLIGALHDFNVHADIICDGIHVHPAVLRMIFSAVPEKLVLISDSMSAAGLRDGSYFLGGNHVTVANGRAALADGTLAGSTTNIYDSLIGLIGYGVPATKAITAATESAAISAGLSKRRGTLKKGRVADLLVLDMEYHLEQVWLGGELYHTVK